MLSLSTAVAIALKTALWILIIGMVSAVFAKKSAACRHFLWSSTLALSLLMPLATLYMPSFAVIAVSWPTSESPLPGISGATVRLSLINAAWPMVLIVWSGGTMALLMRDVLVHVGLSRWVRRARPLRSARWTATLERVSNEMGFSKSLRVLESRHVMSPCTWGFVQPVLLLPISGDAWSESQRRHALLHELAHIRRFDYLSTLISRLACAVHWYNPLVWFAAAQARKLQEQACDDAVLRAGGVPSEYAQFLVSVAEELNRAPAPIRFAMAMAHRSLLHGRIVAILDPHRIRVQPRLLVAVAAVLPLCGLMVLLATTATTTASTTSQRDQPLAHALPAQEEPPTPADRPDPVEVPRPLEPRPEPIEAHPPLPPAEPVPPPPPVEALPPVPPVEPVPPVPPVEAIPSLEKPAPHSSAVTAV